MYLSNLLLSIVFNCATEKLVYNHYYACLTSLIAQFVWAAKSMNSVDDYNLNTYMNKGD